MPIRPFALRLPSSAWAAIAFLLLLASLSSDSIDMMESQTWDYARHDTFPGFINELNNDSAPEAQMPLGMFSFWAWSRAFGTGELAMRSLNLLWAAMALAALARIGRQLSIPWLPALFAIQPFVWYYMDDARSPLMQMAGGALILTGALGYIRRNTPDSAGGILLCLGALLLSGASISGMVPVAAVVIGLSAHGIWQRPHLPRWGKAIAFATAMLLAALAAYYILTLLRKSGGGQLWSVSPANLAFALYEFMGFQGLGPGRQELRTIIKGLVSSKDLLPFLPGILLLAASYVLVFAAAFKSWMTREFTRPIGSGSGQIPPATGPARSLTLIEPWIMGFGVPLLSAVLLYILSTATSTPFWGRNLAGAFPFWILGLGITIHWARQGLWRKFGRQAAMAVVLILLTSSLLIRFAPWHKNDDYRGAAAEAVRISAAGGVVWWVADHSGAIYYGLPLAKTITGAPGEIQFSMNRSEPGSPDAIVLSRSDIFDSLGAAAGLIKSGRYQKTQSLQAFDVWEKPPAR